MLKDFKNYVMIFYKFLRWCMKVLMLIRRRCICVVVYGKFIYVIGGYDGLSILNIVECYDIVR